MSIVKIKNINLLLSEPTSFLSADSASGSTTISVQNLTGYTINQLLLIGFLNFQGSEIIKTSNSVAPLNGTITLLSGTVFPHSASSQIVALSYDMVEISTASTTTGSKTVLTTIPIAVNNDYTNYIDATNSVGYYFARFYNSITTSFSSYSDPIPSIGYTIYSARSVIDSALGMINKKTSVVLSDDFAFREIDNCQMEVIASLKRWSWLQKFNVSLGQLQTGQWTIALPTNCADQNSNKSIYNFKIGTGSNISWVDKEKWNDLTQGVAYTTLANNVNINDTTITLVDSANFTQPQGTVTIGSNSYNYTANNQSTGVLTLLTASTTTNTAGFAVFQGATQGDPLYWTTYGGNIYFYPILDQTQSMTEGFLDYYSGLVQTTTDTQAIVLPDPTVVQYYLAWKFLLKINNGEDTVGTDAKYNKFVEQRDKMIQKESMNRTFQMKPLRNRFQMNSDDPESVRLGNFLGGAF